MMSSVNIFFHFIFILFVACLSNFLQAEANDYGTEECHGAIISCLNNLGERLRGQCDDDSEYKICGVGWSEVRTGGERNAANDAIKKATKHITTLGGYTPVAILEVFEAVVTEIRGDDDSIKKSYTEHITSCLRLVDPEFIITVNDLGRQYTVDDREYIFRVRAISPEDMNSITADTTNNSFRNCIIHYEGSFLDSIAKLSNCNNIQCSSPHIQHIRDHLRYVKLISYVENRGLLRRLTYTYQICLLFELSGSILRPLNKEHLKKMSLFIGGEEQSEISDKGCLDRAYSSTTNNISIKSALRWTPREGRIIRLDLDMEQGHISNSNSKIYFVDDFSEVPDDNDNVSKSRNPSAPCYYYREADNKVSRVDIKNCNSHNFGALFSNGENFLTVAVGWQRDNKNYGTQFKITRGYDRIINVHQDSECRKEMKLSSQAQKSGQTINGINKLREGLDNLGETSPCQLVVRHIRSAVQESLQNLPNIKLWVTKQNNREDRLYFSTWNDGQYQPLSQGQVIHVGVRSCEDWKEHTTDSHGSITVEARRTYRICNIGSSPIDVRTGQRASTIYVKNSNSNSNRNNVVDHVEKADGESFSLAHQFPCSGSIGSQNRCKYYTYNVGRLTEDTQFYLVDKSSGKYPITVSRGYDYVHNHDPAPAEMTEPSVRNDEAYNTEPNVDARVVQAHQPSDVDSGFNWAKALIFSLFLVALLAI